MGISYRSLIGPYVECLTHKVVTSEGKRCCVNKECREFDKLIYESDIKFCPNCGNSIVVKSVSKEENAVNPCLLNEEKDEDMIALYLVCNGDDPLHAKGIDIWFSNLLSRSEYSVKVDKYSDVVQIVPELIEKQKTAFYEANKEWIEFLASKYDKIEVKWGVINYVN